MFYLQTTRSISCLPVSWMNYIPIQKRRINLNRFWATHPQIWNKIGFESKRRQTGWHSINSNNLFLKALEGKAPKIFLKMKLKRDLKTFIFLFLIASMMSKVHKINNNPEYALMNRQKWSHFTYLEKLWIYKSHRYEGKILSQIYQKFGISISTVKRIIKQFDSNVKREEIYSRIRINKKIQSLQIKELISKYVKSASWNFTYSNIQEYILKEWSILIPNHQIRMHLKTHEHLSYKREAQDRIHWMLINWNYKSSYSEFDWHRKYQL